MTRLAFMKIIVKDLAAMQDFYNEAFALEPVDRFDTPEFEEVMLKQADHDFLLMLLRYKDGRDHPDATAHGPTGFTCTDVQAAVDTAVGAGAMMTLAPFDVGPTRVAFVTDPEGHEIELIQFL